MASKRERTLPDGTVLTNKELEDLKQEAKDYIRKMLERACIPSSADADKAIKEALEELLAVYIAHGYMLGSLHVTAKGQHMIDDIIEDLIDKLVGDVYLYTEKAADSNEDKLLLLAFIQDDFHDMTMPERVRRNVNKMADNLRRVLTIDARKNSGVIGEDKVGILAGVTGVEAIKALVRNEVARAWIEERRRRHEDARYVHVFRGSSYLCDICDAEEAKGWQEIDKAELPTFHRNCCCYVVYA